jgi:hypothetical protein
VGDQVRKYIDGESPSQQPWHGQFVSHFPTKCWFLRFRAANILHCSYRHWQQAQAGSVHTTGRSREPRGLASQSHCFFFLKFAALHKGTLFRLLCLVTTLYTSRKRSRFSRCLLEAAGDETRSLLFPCILQADTPYVTKIHISLDLTRLSLLASL